MHIYYFLWMCLNKGVGCGVIQVYFMDWWVVLGLRVLGLVSEED
jgi:hypothetical protein